MTVELADIERAVVEHQPFCWLPEEAVTKLVRAIEVSYTQAGEQVLAYGDAISHLYFVRSGEVEVFRRNGQLFNRLSEGYMFGQMGLFMQGRARFSVNTISDSLFYLIPAPIFIEFCDLYERFGDYFEANESSVLEQATQVGADDMTTVPVTEILRTDPLLVPPELNIADCAKLMTEQSVSAALVQAEDGGSRDVIGLLTDSDLRERVIAHRLPFDTQVQHVMTSDIEAMDEHAYVHEVMLTMLRNNIHHVPIMNDEQVLGLVSLPDVVSHESQNSLLLVRSILSSESVDTLALLSERVPAVYARLVNEHATSHMIGSAMSVIGSSFMQHLATLAEQTLGPAPVPYCLIALGSLARDEQLLVTDQDNALILSDRYDEQTHGAYFKAFSDILCDGLDRCGYPYCEGEIMASNPKWRLTLTQWKAQFGDWIDNPEPQALLNASIFFDLKAVHGAKLWVKELQKFITDKAADNRPFLSLLARNALKRTAPLGFFKGFVLEENGKQRPSINIKRRGTAPLTDIVRVHALATGSISQNSFERLEDISKTKLLPEGKFEELTNALDLLYSIRARQQMLCLKNGEELNNQVDPEALNGIERRAMKEAFSLITQAQRFLKFRYTVSG